MKLAKAKSKEAYVQISCSVLSVKDAFVALLINEKCQVTSTEISVTTSTACIEFTD